MVKQKVFAVSFYLFFLPRVSVVGEGFLGKLEKLLPSRPKSLHSFFSGAVEVFVSMMIFIESLTKNVNKVRYRQINETH